MTGTLLYIILFVVGTVGKGLYEVYKKKQAVLEVERAQREREQEMLRTGRDPALEARLERVESSATRGAEAMREREEALRRARQAAEAAEVRGAATGEQTVRKQLWPGGPVVEVRGPSRGPGPQGGGRVPAPQAARRGAGAQPGRVGPGGKPARQQKQSKKRARVEPPPVQRAIYEEPLRRDRMVEVEVERVVEPVRMALRSTRDQWRAAVIAAEVLGAPVSLRGPGGGQ